MSLEIKTIFNLSLICLFALCGQVRTEDLNGTTTVTPESIDKDDLANVINNVGYKIMTNMMSAEIDKNIIISPVGIAGLLAMTLLGTVGKSYDELAETLGFSQDIIMNRQHHENFGNLLKSLNSNDTTTKTMYADALFIDSKSKLREAFRTYLKTVYEGEARTVDFSDRDTVKMEINEWVSNHTNGKISDFLKEPLRGDTKTVLMSALYFSGKWKSPFFQEYTMKFPFKKSNGVVLTDLMMNMGHFDSIYSVEDDVHMVAIPYNDGTTLYALKPRKPHKQNLTELMNNLNYTKIDNLINKMQSRKLIIRFPKMDLNFSANLEDPLKALGIQSIFIPGKANFALMIDSTNALNKTENELIARINYSKDLDLNLKNIIDDLPNPGVYVDSILHDVRITIDEYGTEAVAATLGILGRSAEMFYADSPFYMFIRNDKTKLVTFSAVIFDPTC
ncbi:plasminogen activator inhibitor 1-like [Vanessa tameamea]|uniref:Plasminogen activator inhibitor 1-like n=1 Tax=Vanessa tameamea TaxID=334116 RepID=A0A8B8HFX2_VANTA|nr:plasminogen activator inhibitor 1-like [Vanessa tameamea]XP_026483736.1 plasminogen activator inhibitor 1-like [Vanessa tameamea]